MRRKLITWLDGKHKYVWKRVGKLNYQRDWKLLQDRLSDLKAARDCVKRACGSSWWEWHSGSRPVFWRWPPDCVISAKDGRPNYIKDNLPVCLQKQHSPESGSFQKVKKKQSKVLAWGYISLSSEVKSLTHFFPVPKTWKVEGSKRVPNDFNMVYDATRSGLNKAVWCHCSQFQL